MGGPRGKTLSVSAAMILTAFCASGARAEGWRTYHNARFGTTADVPESWAMGEPPENDDGRIFTAPDKRSELIVSGSFHVLPHEEEIAIKLAPNEGETVAYVKRGKDWIVVSGTKGDEIFYRKSILSCNGTIWNSVSIRYPSVEKGKFDPLVVRVAGSLRSGRGYGFVAECR
ncbi:MAG: hypothetical protein C3F11_13490 [Methylocystaceae bacterium]|nr:MAG: hypothetical protein C3F11_13490 [Methylocystaceae bacterium]